MSRQRGVFRRQRFGGHGADLRIVGRGRLPPAGEHQVEDHGHGPEIGLGVEAAGATSTDPFRQFGFGNDDWFNEWDADRNQMLSEDEFNRGAYGTWDANDDNVLDENEYYGGLFDAWDADQSGYVEEAEYDTGSGWFD